MAGPRATLRLDLEQGVGAPELLADDELRAIVDRDAGARAAFVGAVMGVAVDDRSDIVEAVDRVRQPLRAEILVDLDRLALERVDDRRVMEHRDSAVGAQRAQPVLELARL